MKTILLSLSLMIVMVGCGENNLITPVTRADRNYVITQIKSSQPNISRYEAMTNTSYLNYMNDISFYDSTGKYAIGDTILIEFKIKNKQ